MDASWVGDGDGGEGTDTGIQVQEVQGDDFIVVQIPVGMAGDTQKSPVCGDIFDQDIQKPFASALHFADFPERGMEGHGAVLRYTEFFQLGDDFIFCKHGMLLVLRLCI